MADGDLLSLLLKVEGGEASAVEIEKVRSALKGVEHENDALKERFQEGFQHIALKGFLTDAGRSIGLGGELRPIVHLLNVGITQLGASMGLAGGTTALLGAGFLALSAAGYVVFEHFKKHNENLEELIKKQAEARDTTDSLKESLSHYKDTVIELPPHLKKLQQAVTDLDEVQTKNIRETEQKKLAVDRETYASNQRKIESLEDLVAGNQKIINSEGNQINVINNAKEIVAEKTEKIKALREANRILSDSIDIATANIVAQGKGAKDAKDHLDKLTEAHHKLVEAEKKDEAAFEKWNAGIDKKIEKEKSVGVAFDETENKIAALQRLGQEIELDGAEATTDAYKKKLAQIEKYRIQKQAEINQLHEAALKTAVSDAQILSANQRFADDNVALSRTVAKKIEQTHTEIQDSAIAMSKEVGTAIEHGIGDAFAKSIVEGKSFEESMKAMSTQIAEQIISDLIRIAIQAQITQLAVSGIFGGPAGGAVTSARIL